MNKLSKRVLSLLLALLMVLGTCDQALAWPPAWTTADTQRTA